MNTKHIQKGWHIGEIDNQIVDENGIYANSPEDRRLQVAAPELLEAAKLALSDLRVIYAKTYSGQHSQLEKAIAKAEGEVKT